MLAAKLLTDTLNYSVQKHTEQHMPYIYIYVCIIVIKLTSVENLVFHGVSNEDRILVNTKIPSYTCSFMMLGGLLEFFQPYTVLLCLPAFMYMGKKLMKHKSAKASIRSTISHTYICSKLDCERSSEEHTSGPSQILQHFTQWKF